MSHPIPKVVKLDSDIRDRLERLGQAKHRSPHWLMKAAITRYVEQEEYNEALNHETLTRWQEATQGKVVSHHAVSRWLDTWGTDDETDRPPCGEVVWLDSAVNDAVRLRAFIAKENPDAAKKAASAIKTAAQRLIESPLIGKPVEDLPQFRDLLVPFGAAGYILRYRAHAETLYIAHISHYKEVDFMLY